ncbi:MAG TPA: flagellar hook-associated protein FlgL [Pantanalinema sp.]
MRVTNKMISDSVYRNAGSHLEKMADLQEKLASGKAINKPSDNPSAVNVAMLLRNTLADQDQYVSNLKQVDTWLDTGDQTIGSGQTVMLRALELATQGASDTGTPESRKAIAQEVRELQEQLRGIANTQLAGRFIFAGSQTLTEPYPKGAAPDPTKIDNVDALTAEIGPGIAIRYNVTGTEVFGATTDPNSAFKVLDDLAVALESDDGKTTGAQIDRINARIDTMSLQRAGLGGKKNRSELLAERYSATEVSLRDLLSANEEVDMPKVISQLTLSTSVYQASLAASARIVQPSLMDFLK